jgi:hypothetical protein
VKFCVWVETFIVWGYQREIELWLTHVAGRFSVQLIHFSKFRGKWFYAEKCAKFSECFFPLKNVQKIDFPSIISA